MKPIANLKALAHTSIRGTPEAKPRDVFITTGPLGVIVGVEGTPGQWYYDTFTMACLDYPAQTIAIDIGQHWTLENPHRICKAVNQEIARLLNTIQS